MRIVEIQAAPINVVENEKKYLQLQQQICAKRKFLSEQEEKMRKIKKENEFLEKVRDDYSKYNYFIKKQREEQINAFNNLNEYLNNLTQKGNLSKNNIRDAKAEQKKILDEIKKINQTLEEIIKE